MVERSVIEKKIQERGFTVYASMPSGKHAALHFVSDHSFTFAPKERKPVINIIVDLDTEEFEVIYNIPGSINMIRTPKCGSVMKDVHFDTIVGNVESHARWLARITG